MRRGSKPETIDEYLTATSPEKRAALQRLRRTIRAAAPTAEECISYGIPTFRIDGKMLASFGAASKHCSLYIGARPITVYRRELAAFGLSKGTIRFLPDHPIPTALIRRLIRTRIAERSSA